MRDLIEALWIFSKYTSDERPINTAGEEFFVNVDPGEVSPVDLVRLEELSFHSEGKGFVSLRFT